MRILGIECTCDDTGVALIEDGILITEEKSSSWDYHASQHDIDKIYAADHHSKQLPILVKKVLLDFQLNLYSLDAIALSTGPGLNPSLAIGLLFVQSLYDQMIQQNKLNQLNGLPESKLPKFIPINHLQAHLLVPLMKFPNIQFPFITLILSGAHTQLILAEGYFNYTIQRSLSGFGAGAMLDQISRCWQVKSFGLGSGGAALEKLAEEFTGQIKDADRKILVNLFENLSMNPGDNWESLTKKLLIDSNNNLELIQQNLPAAAYYLQKGWVQLVIDWVNSSNLSINQLVVAGGVASNRYLVDQISRRVKAQSLYWPPLKHCCDNGAMIAYTGYISLREKTNVMDFPWGFCLKHEWNLPQNHQNNQVNLCPEWDQIEPSLEQLNQGKVIAFPTETVYGLGANAYDQNHVAGIYQAKGRPSDNPLIIHVADYNQLKELVPGYPHKSWLPKLLQTCWPGPLSVVLPDPNPRLAQNVHSHHLNTVAVRMPDHPLALRLIEQYGKPLAAPSANTSGKPSPTLARHVIDDLGQRIGGVLNGGNCVKGIESTILDCTVDPPLILREGPYTQKDLQEILNGEVELKGKESKGSLTDGERPKAPGMKYTHYKPDVALITLSGSLEQVIEWLKTKKTKESKRIGWIVWKEQHLTPQLIIQVKQMYICGNLWDNSVDVNTYLMNHLYASFWELNQVDQLDLMAIWIDGISHLGILEKLEKASVEKIRL